MSTRWGEPGHDWDDDYDDDDLDNTYTDSERYDSEDERAAKRGTSECDNTCHPQCNWCLVAHACPDDCAGGVCPYEALARKQEKRMPPVEPTSPDEIEF
jgi:hypothetical protein